MRLFLFFLFGFCSLASVTEASSKKLPCRYASQQYIFSHPKGWIMLPAKQVKQYAFSYAVTDSDGIRRWHTTKVKAWSIFDKGTGLPQGACFIFTLKSDQFSSAKRFRDAFVSQSKRFSPKKAHFRLIKKDAVKLPCGTAYASLSSCFMDDMMQVKKRDFFIEKRNRVYFVDFVIFDEAYSSLNPIINKVMQSFKPKKG